MTTGQQDYMLALQHPFAGRFVLERLLGRGGMGMVFLAREVALDRQVAIKTLLPDFARDPAIRERFVREAQFAARLSHPNIVPVHAVENGDIAWFSMALVRGVSLRQYVGQRGPLASAEVARITRELAWALAHAHSHGLVHRDVKPENVFIEDGTGRVLLMDFGIAQAGELVADPFQHAASFHYASPEQLNRALVDQRSDLFSLGLTACFALSAQVPPHRDVQAIPDGTPAWLAKPLAKCLAVDPSDRYETADQIAAAVTPPAHLSAGTPPMLRRWLTAGLPLRGFFILWSFFWGVTGLASAYSMDLAGTVQLTILIFLPWLAHLFIRVVQTRQVLARGYTLYDLRDALRRDRARVRDELAMENGGTGVWQPGFLAKAGLIGVIITIGLGLFALWQPTARGALGMLVAIFAVGSAITLLFGRARGRRPVPVRDVPQDLRNRFWHSLLGVGFARLARMGLPPMAVPADALRPTEVVLGDQIMSALAALPTGARAELRDVPSALARLQVAAAEIRQQLDAMDLMPTSIGADDVMRAMSRQKEALLRQQSLVLAALDKLRDGLLRLRLGELAPSSITADLEVANRAHADVQRALSHNNPRRYDLNRG